MAEVAKLPVAADTPCVVRIVGRVEDYRSYEMSIYTRIAVPAPDEYSMPALLEVRSDDPIGPVSQMVDIRAKITGFPGKPFKSVDDRTGREITVRQVKMFLDLVK